MFPKIGEAENKKIKKSVNSDLGFIKEKDSSQETPQSQKNRRDSWCLNPQLKTSPNKNEIIFSTPQLSKKPSLKKSSSFKLTSMKQPSQKLSQFGQNIDFRETQIKFSKPESDNSNSSKDGIFNEQIQQAKKKFIISKFNTNNSKKTQQQQQLNMFGILGGVETLKRIVKKLFLEIQNDHVLKSKHYAQLIIKQEWFTPEILENIQPNFVNYLCYITGDNRFYNLDILQEKHQNLLIKREDYNIFKFYLLKSFVSVTDQPGQLQPFNQTLRKYEHLIFTSNKQCIQQILSDQINGKYKLNDFIQKIIQEVYEKIKNDSYLGLYFHNVETDKIMTKFQIIFYKILDRHKKYGELELQGLRQMHKGFNLEEVHFVRFRQLLINTLRNNDIDLKLIYKIAKRVNFFKPYILNQDTLTQKLKDNKIAPTTFMERFSGQCLHDGSLQNMSLKLDRKFFHNHREYIFNYFTSQRSISLRDLQIIHNHDQDRYLITNIEVDRFISIFLNTCNTLSVDKSIREDFILKWENLKDSILNKQSIKSSIGTEQTDQLKLRVIKKIDSQYKVYYQKSEFNMSSVVSRIFQFLFSKSKAFTKQDIYHIHENLEIRENSYDYLSFIIENEAREMGISTQILKEIEHQFQEYKQFIVMKNQDQGQQLFKGI